MLEYFPGNYVANLSLNLALSTGAQIGEVDEACRPLLSTGPSEDGPSPSEQFFASWCALADRLAEVAAEDEENGHPLAAAARYERASVYYLTAERMQKFDYEPRAVAYKAGLESFRKAVTLGRQNCEFVEIPYSPSNATLSGLLIRGEGDGPRPFVVHVNGLDSTKEMLYGTGIAQELARRGVSTLIIDQPGTGEALRLNGIHGVAESELYGSACFDYLAGRDDCDATRIGIAGWSLGGYFAPRIAAFDDRFALCVAWGAIYDWPELHRRRITQEQANEATAEDSVPHFVEHIMWVFGQKTPEDFIELALKINLVEASKQIRMPFLVIHGENDQQVPVDMAEKQYEAAVNSSHRTLKIMTERDGGIEHVAADNISPTTNYIADWVADVFAGKHRKA